MRTLFLFLLVSIPGSLLSQSAPPLLPDDIYWSDQFGSAGVSGTIHVVLTEGCEDIFVGGEFTAIGGVPARNVARWDGSNWHSVGLGSENGVDGPVYALAMFRDQLVAGGRFDSAGTIAAMNIARFDGSEWVGLGRGVIAREEFELAVPAFVYSLEATAERLYVGGRFDTANAIVARNVASWTTEGWRSLGSGLLGDNAGSPPDRGVVYSLEAGRNGLFAGGRFATSGSEPLRGLARWDGSRWFGLSGSPVRGDGKVEVRSLYSDGLDLYVGGRFDSAGGISVNNVTLYRGLDQTWHGFGSGSQAVVRALELDGSQLYASGRFRNAEGVVIEELAVWRDGDWRSAVRGDGAPADSTVFSIAADAGEVYVGGAFGRIGPAVAAGIAALDVSTRTWRALNLPGGAAAGGLNGPVYAVALDSVYLYVGGAFTAAGLVPVRSLARWNRSTGVWSSVGGEIDVDPRVRGRVIPVVRAMELLDGDLYVAGRFDLAAGLQVNNIARWDGRSWHRLGEGIGQNGTGPAYDSTSTILAMEGQNGTLFVGGEFIYAGGDRANRIAQWNPITSEWSSLAGGIGGSSFNTRVYALAADDENLFAAGVFPVAGSTRASNIARWDGTEWFDVSGGANNAVFALALDSAGALYAGGSFTSAGNESATYVASWDGMEWSPLAAGTNAPVRALCATDSGVIAGGEFTASRGLQLGFVGRWEGGEWLQLGSGLSNSLRNGTVRALDRDSEILAAGGDFDIAGGDPSLNIAIWELQTPPAAEPSTSAVETETTTLNISID